MSEVKRNYEALSYIGKLLKKNKLTGEFNRKDIDGKNYIVCDLKHNNNILQDNISLFLSSGNLISNLACCVCCYDKACELKDRIEIRASIRDIYKNINKNLDDVMYGNLMLILDKIKEINIISAMD